MASRGVLLAITPDEMMQLLNTRDDAELMKVFRRLDKKYLHKHSQETQHLWAMIHECLGDGSLEWEGGKHPLNKCILGGHNLHRGPQYWVRLVMPAWVPQVAAALAKFSKKRLHSEYESVCDMEDEDSDEEEWEWLWEFFTEVKEFYAQAAKEKRAVVFKVDR